MSCCATYARFIARATRLLPVISRRTIRDMRAVLLIQILSMTIIATLFALALAARVGAGILLIMAAFMVEAVASRLPLREVAGTNVYPADAVFSVLSLAYVIRLLRRRYWTILDVLWIVFGICIALAWVRGMRTSGLNIATNSARDFFYLWAGAAYVGSFEWKPTDFILIYRNWVAVSLLLFIVVMSRYFYPLYAIDITLAGELEDGIDHVFEHDADFVALRFLTASQAYLISQAALMSVAVGSRSRTVDFASVSIPFWVAFVVTLQHRTVWVTFLISMAVLLPSLRLHRSQVLAIVGGMTLAACAAVWAAVSSRQLLMVRSLIGAMSEVSNAGDSTFSFRIQLWENYFMKFVAGTPLELAIGQPFGTVVYSWIPVGRNLVFTDIFPHNSYIQGVFFTGLLGLAAIVVMYSIVIRWSWGLASAQQGRMTGRDLSVLLMGQVIYSTTYGLKAEQCIITGVAMGLCASAWTRLSGASRRLAKANAEFQSEQLEREVEKIINFGRGSNDAGLGLCTR
jgi:hypothetical protein